MRAYESHNKTLCAATFMVIDIDIAFPKGEKKKKAGLFGKFQKYYFLIM